MQYAGENHQSEWINAHPTDPSEVTDLSRAVDSGRPGEPVTPKEAHLVPESLRGLDVS